MTKQQAKQLKALDWVWAYKFASPTSRGDIVELDVSRCYVLTKPDVSTGIITLGRITTVCSIQVPIRNIFHTKEEAQKAMLEEVKSRIEVLKEDNEKLLYGIKDRLAWNQCMLSQLGGIMAILTRSM